MITPQELAQKEFSRVIRGYSAAEVDAFVEEVKSTCIELYNKNAELEKQVAILTAQNAELTNAKPTPKYVIDKAQAEADKIIGNANDEAAIIIASSKTSCDNLLNEFRFRLGAERDKLVELQTAVRNFKAAIYSAYQEHIDSVESIVDEADFDALDMEAQEYSTKVVSDIKTEVAYLMAELNQKREREAATKIDDVYFENRDAVLEEELKNEESAEISGDTVVFETAAEVSSPVVEPEPEVIPEPIYEAETVQEVFDPDVDLSDLPDEMDENDPQEDVIEALDISMGEVISEVPEAETDIGIADDEPEEEPSYDDILEKFAEELKEESTASSDE